jgi:hypothetical protein
VTNLFENGGLPPARRKLLPLLGNNRATRAAAGKALALGRKGCSNSEIAIALGVSMTSLRLWSRECVVFGDALAFSRELALAYWERLGQRLLLSEPSRQAPNLNKRTRRKHRRRLRLGQHAYLAEIVRRFPAEYGPSKGKPGRAAPTSQQSQLASPRRSHMKTRKGATSRAAPISGSQAQHTFAI